MNLAAIFAPSRFMSTLLHVVLPSASLLVILTMFWIGFSSQREPVLETSSEAVGATNLTYSAQLADGAILRARAESAVFLPTQIKASGARGSIVYPNGFVRNFTTEKANAGWDLSYAGFENGVFSETHDNGSILTVWLETGSAGSNGLIGRQVKARYDVTAQSSRGNLVANQLFIKSDLSSANVSGDANVTWSDPAAADWISVHSDKFEIHIEESLIESVDEARFELLGGMGKAGKLKIIETGEKIEFLDGVEFTYQEPES